MRDSEMAGAIIPAAEGLQVEFKPGLEGTQKRSVCKEIAAFASTEGGSLFIGIDDNGEVVGLTPEDAQVSNEQIEAWINSNVSPVPTVEVRRIEIGERTIVQVEVQKGSAPLYYYDQRPYIRVGSLSQVAAPKEVIERIFGWHVHSAISGINKDIEQIKAGWVVTAGIMGQGQLATMNYDDLLQRLRKDLGL